MEGIREILPYKRMRSVHTKEKKELRAAFLFTKHELIATALSFASGLACVNAFFLPVLFSFFVMLLSVRQRTILLSAVLMLSGALVHLKLQTVGALGATMIFAFLGDRLFLRKHSSVESYTLFGTSLWGVLQMVQLFWNGFLWYDFLNLLLSLIAVLVSSYLFQMAAPTVLSLKPSESREETISILVLISFLALSVPNTLFFSVISPRAIVSLTFLLYIAYEKGVTLGALGGLYLGLINSVGTSDAAMTVTGYALCGMLGGIFNRVGKIGTVVSVCLGNALTAFFLNGSTEVLISFFDILLSALLCFVLLNQQIGQAFSYILPKPSSELLGNARMDIWLKKVNHTALGLETVAQILEDKEGAKKPERDFSGEQRKAGISEQLRCIKGLLQSFGKTAMEEDEEFSELEKRILSKLKNRKIAVRALHVKKSDFGAFACEMLLDRVLTDKRKQEVCEVLKTVLGQRLAQIRMQEYENSWLYQFSQKERYKVQIGGAVCSKNRTEKCGDCSMTAHLSDGKYLISVSDGMGTGKKAFHESYTAVTLFDEMLESGVPYEHALRMVNSILYLKSPEETFATMDVALIDLYTGMADFLKMGAAATFWVSRREIHVICATSMPMGLMHKLDVECMRHRLNVGDYLIMVTDGVLDRTPREQLPEVWFAEKIEQATCSHPQDLAEELLQTVLKTESSHRDDMTVLVARIERAEEG